MKKEFKLEDEYDELYNVSVGDYGYVKGGFRRENKREECIKVILKRKCDPSILAMKMASLGVLQKLVGEGLSEYATRERDIWYRGYRQEGVRMF